MTDKKKLEKLKKLADAMYYAAQYLTTDASRLHKAMDEYHKFTIHECKEEPVNDDLEEASRNYADNEEYGDDVYFAIEAAFKAGARWQKEHPWKPSEEQIEALEHSLGDYNIKIFEDRYEILKSLYNDLKKLKEE